MNKAILAKKVGMTQIFNADGVLTPVTVLQAGPCYVTQVKTIENDGYEAVQVGFDDVREKLVTKPVKGHLDKAGVQTASDHVHPEGGGRGIECLRAEAEQRNGIPAAGGRWTDKYVLPQGERDGSTEERGENYSKWHHSGPETWHSRGDSRVRRGEGREWQIQFCGRWRR